MKQADQQTAPGAKQRTRGRTVSATTFVVAGLWFSVVVLCMGWTMHYTSQPGRVGEIPGRRPVASQIHFDTSRPTLIMFAHPHCPCTRASIGELARLMTDCYGLVNAQVWFVKPDGTTADWTNTDLWASAAAIPGVTVHCDDTGGEARRFQAETSGQTMLYDAGGRLLFAGGITIARGHSGDNPGRSALAAILQDKFSTRIQTPVFGCSLFDDECRQPAANTSGKP